MSDPFDLDALEAKAVDALTHTYGKQPRTARFWMQKGIEGMRLAVALAKEAIEHGTCIDCDRPMMKCSCENVLRCSCGVPDEVCPCANLDTPEPDLVKAIKAIVEVMGFDKGPSEEEDTEWANRYLPLVQRCPVYNHGLYQSG